MPAAGSPGEPYGSAEWCHSKSAGAREGTSGVGICTSYPPVCAQKAL